MSFIEPQELPSLAGLSSLNRATQADWSVEQSVELLKMLHFTLKKISETLVSRITAEPVYELKTLFSHHAYLCAEQVQAVRKRVSEMREPPLGLEAIPNPVLGFCLSEVDSCPDSLYLIDGIYNVLLPFVLDSCNFIKSNAHPLADAPTVRLSKLMEFELTEMQALGATCVNGFIANPEETESRNSWCEMLKLELSQLTPRVLHDTGKTELQPNSKPVFSGKPRAYQSAPRRDKRFIDPYNAGVNPEAFLYDEKYSARDKTLMMYYKRLRELDVPEMMASILVELRDEEPWEFHFEMTRQLWDEARHAMMGEVGFASLGVDWTRIPINWTWSLNLNNQLNARERHGVLFFIEQGLMPKTGKKYEWEIARESNDALSAVFQDFDWADEVLHAQIGRRWYVPRFASLQAGLNYGDKCWSKVLSHWRTYKEQGLTNHENWWPQLYAEACQRWGVQPDEEALAFDTSYEDLRADLNEI